MSLPQALLNHNSVDSNIQHGVLKMPMAINDLDLDMADAIKRDITLLQKIFWWLSALSFVGSSFNLHIKNIRLSLFCFRF